MLPPSVKCVLGGVLNGGGSTSTFCERDFPNHNDVNRVWTPTNFVVFENHFVVPNIDQSQYFVVPFPTSKVLG